MPQVSEVSGWFVMLLGMGTVFVGLICLIYITKIMSWLLGAGKKKAAPVLAPVTCAPVAAPAIQNRPAFVAAIAAAIATQMGTEPSGLRICSIRPIDASAGGGERKELVAAISAAIATQMGTDVSGLRIHSIRPL